MDERNRDLTSEGIENSVEGKSTDLKGHIKDAAGGLTGDTSLQAEGKLDQLKGTAQDALGKIQRKLGSNDTDRGL